MYRSERSLSLQLQVQHRLHAVEVCSHMCSETPRSYLQMVHACFDLLWASEPRQGACHNQHSVQACCPCTGTLAPAASRGVSFGSKAPSEQASLYSSSSAGFGAQSELTTAQLMHAAKMARLSGFTYRPVEDLSDWLSKEGLQLVARGQTHFTRSVSMLSCNAIRAVLFYALSGRCAFLTSSCNGGGADMHRCHST